MAANRATAAQLAYVPATAVEAILVEFARLPVETTDRARVGELAGLVIDVARRRLRFLVVENSHWAGRAGRLVPLRMSGSLPNGITPGTRRVTNGDAANPRPTLTNGQPRTSGGSGSVPGGA